MRPPDEAQRKRIRNAPAGARLLVAAGPGTGKTEMAAARMAGLVRKGLPPGQLLVLSFSRSAVRNLTDRLARLDGTDDRILEELRHVSIRTFDSWAFRMLRLLGNPAAALLARRYDENIEELAGLIGGRRREAVRTLVGDRRHLIVDEFQDLPGVRGELVLALLDLLAPPGGTGAGFTILGDPAQAIYAFAATASGSAFPTPAEYWKRVRESYGAELELVELTHNYRADRPLADLSSSLRRVLLSGRSDEEKLRVVREAVAALPPAAEPADASWLGDAGPGSRAILTRTNGESLRVLACLFGKNVKGGATPVRLRAGNHASLPPAWIGALLGRLRSAELPRSQFARIYDHLTGEWDEATCRSLGLPGAEVTWARLCRASGAREDAPGIRIPDLRSRLNWPDAFPDDQLAGEDGLLVTTIHQSKGLEFDVVTVLDATRDAREETGGEEGKHDSALDEASVNYVAVTRASRELRRMGGTELYGAPRRWTLQSGRWRLRHWRNGWMNVEVGLHGDLDPFGFVDSRLHGGSEAVAEVQAHLLRGARTLRGHKVMLVKHAYGRKALWHVHLQTPDGQAGLLVGRTGGQLSHDLLEMIYGKGFALPSRIYNLRIAAIGTVASDAEFVLDEPYRTSRLWLGVSLFGTGDFRTFRRKP